MHIRSALLSATAVAAFLLAPMNAAFAAEEAAKTETAAPAPSILVATAAKREIVETLSVNGSIVPREEVSAGADVAGLMVLELTADQGDVVKEGQVLARLDRAALEVQLAQINAQRAQAQAAVAQAEAQIGDAEVGVRQAQEDLDRVAPLFKRRIASESQRDQAVNALDSAKAKLNTANMGKASAEAQLALIDAQERDVQLKLSKTEVKAPADGIVLARSAQLGSMVSGSAGPLFRLAKANQFELAADVPEADIARLSVDMPVAIALPGRGESIQGKIRLISPEVDAKSRLGKVRVAIPAEANVRSGTFGRGVIELLRREGVAAPIGALLYREGKAYLQVVENDTIESREVTLGARADGFAEVTNGLAEGEVFVARAGTFVADGDRIKPVQEAEKTGAIDQ